ncbi:hypothetical protein BN1221_02691 [Brenneria goodwinii]|uniref:Uncharacterized protein n=1 Tax=Brenneria goodwinii TaxID=1109412 RepID=A0A0G4JWE2_9GAMM|nr:hypothetical protein BN1221_02691 [Brenneria goodwinii]
MPLFYTLNTDINLTIFYEVYEFSVTKIKSSKTAGMIDVMKNINDKRRKA